MNAARKEDDGLRIDARSIKVPVDALHRSKTTQLVQGVGKLGTPSGPKREARPVEPDPLTEERYQAPRMHEFDGFVGPHVDPEIAQGRSLLWTECKDRFRIPRDGCRWHHQVQERQIDAAVSTARTVLGTVDRSGTEVPQADRTVKVSKRVYA